MKKYFFGVLILVTFVACDTLISKDRIPEDKLVKILVDIHMADGTLTAKGFKVSQDSLVILQYYDYIFVKHKTTPKSFETTLEYYTKHSDKLDLIYIDVLEQITAIESNITKDDNLLEK